MGRMNEAIRDKMRRFSNLYSQAPERIAEFKGNYLDSQPISFQKPPFDVLSAGFLIPKGSHVFFLFWHLVDLMFIHLLRHIEVICQITSSGKKNVLGYYSLVQMSQTDCLHGGNVPDNYFNHVFPFRCVYMVPVFQINPVKSRIE